MFNHNSSSSKISSCIRRLSSCDAWFAISDEGWLDSKPTLLCRSALIVKDFIWSKWGEGTGICAVTYECNDVLYYTIQFSNKKNLCRHALLFEIFFLSVLVTTHRISNQIKAHNHITSHSTFLNNSKNAPWHDVLPCSVESTILTALIMLTNADINRLDSVALNKLHRWGRL